MRSHPPARHRPVHQVGSVLGETIAGTALVAAGLWFVLAAVTTPLASDFAATVRVTPGQPIEVLLAWSAVIAAPMVLVLLGTDRLARLLALARTGHWRRSRRDPFGALPADVVLVRGVALDDGREAPTMVVGPFGLAVIHESPPFTSSAWEDPRDAVARDAERVRRSLLQHDVDFVVRIYAALVTSEVDLPRTNGCAVVTPEQVPAWIASLPRQRSLTPERCARVVSMLRGV